VINLKIQEPGRKNNLNRCREKKILLPTFEQMKDPSGNNSSVKEGLSKVGLWDVNPLNLFRITWKNEKRGIGGGFGGVNYFEFPKELTGVNAKIIALIGKWFPTGAHKVGATYGCLAPELVTGNFDLTKQKAVWPSTGNYCRGGAFNSALLGCESVAILPEEMSRERFDWLRKLAGEVIATPGCESNVKEIFDKCGELRKNRTDIKIFNQFEEFGNYLWHYDITGSAIREVFEKSLKGKGNAAGYITSTGSAGTIAAGDYLKQRFPQIKIGAAEALQCPTLLMSGFGAHRIEGIGDKHVPWIHNIRNTDMVIAIDDQDCIELIRLFNEDAGKNYLINKGVNPQIVQELNQVGISGAANLLASIKFAKYYELNESDIVFTILTDSMELYESRLKELNEKYGNYDEEDAIISYNKSLMGANIASMKELSYYDRKQIHNLKYFTWVEQQQKSLSELNAQWYEYPDYWNSIQSSISDIEKLINEFNSELEII